MCSKILLILVGTILLQTCKVISVNDPKLVRTEPITNQKTVDILTKYIPKVNAEDFKLLSTVEINKQVDILISKKLLPKLVEFLNDNKIKYEVVNKNFQKLLDDEGVLEEQIPVLQDSDQLSWKKYNNYEEIYKYCDALAAVGKRASGAFIITECIGETAERRQIKLVKVTNGHDMVTKPAIWLDGGMHAREWISVATVTYILKMLVLNGPRTQKLLEAFDWYIVPVVNVDGYAYTWDGKRERNWRKNRKINGFFIKGVDLNRNFSVGWGAGADDGTDWAINETYQGPEASSELETQAICAAILERKKNIKMYLSFHSYSQLILIPRGPHLKQADDYEELLQLANLGKDAIEETYGTQYKVGTVRDLLNKTVGGGSDDWAKAEAGIKYSYIFELRGSATERNATD